MTGLDHQPAPQSTSALDLRIIFWSLLGRLADRREPLARRLDGLLSVVNMKPQPVDDERYWMEVVGTELTRPGESAVIDPRENDVHAVYSPVRSRSLHVYPDDNYHAFGYVHQEDGDPERDVYVRERFELRECDEE